MRITRISITAVLLAVAASASAQPAALTNAQVRMAPVGGTLATSFDAVVAGADQAAWIAYAVPLVRGDRFMCDWNERSPRPPARSVKLEGADTFYVFFRVESRSVDRIRMFSEGCAIDAGGLVVQWLQGVDPDQSVTLLGRYVAADSPRRLVNGALAALAMHQTGAADAALLTAARSGATSHVRAQALFWTAQRAGDRAVPVISEAIANDPDTDVKKRAVFALSQLPAGEGIPHLIDVAEHHSNPAVRKQAMFWLGQSRDPRALAFFERILLK